MIMLIVFTPFFLIVYIILAITLNSVTGISGIFWFIVLSGLTVWGSISLIKKITPQREKK